MKTILCILGIALGLIVVGCNENGDSGFYDNVYRVYFPKDSIRYNFGDKPVELTSYTVNVPVEVLGLPADKEIIIKVSVDEKATTAPEGAYVAVPTEILIKKDSVLAYIPVELIRADIPSEKDTTFHIVLRLEPNDNFELGVKESLQSVVVFSNFLAKPDWWIGLQDYCLGIFQKEKYQKMIELWGGPITLDDFFFRSAKIISVAQEMYYYFQEHPEYGMVFPPEIVWPYE